MGFAFNAIFTEPSFFALITTGATKNSLVHLFNLTIWPSLIRRLISSPTFTCLWIGILLPFSLIGIRGCLKTVCTRWFFDLLSLMKMSLYVLSKNSSNGCMFTPCHFLRPLNFPGGVIGLFWPLLHLVKLGLVDILSCFLDSCRHLVLVDILSCFQDSCRHLVLADILSCFHVILGNWLFDFPA